MSGVLGAPHPNEKITDEGRLSLVKVRQRRPEYAAAIESGFVWEELDWEAEEAWPDLIDLLQEVSNAGHAKSETRLEVALKVCETAKRFFAAEEGKPEGKRQSAEQVWKDVAKIAGRSTSKEIASEVEDICKYVKVMSGETSF